MQTCPDHFLNDYSKFEEIQFKPNSDGHIFLLHIDELAPLAIASGLLVEEIRLFTNPLTAGHIKMGKLLNVLPKRFVDKVEAITASRQGRICSKINSHMLVVFHKL